jgi:hypothetical protein
MNSSTTINLVDQTVFKGPFTCMIAGPTQSGKTSLLSKVLSNLVHLIQPNPTRIVYCYSRPQEAFKSMSGIEFNEGLPNLDEFDPKENNLIILDDLMDQCEKDKSILNLFTVDSHHKNISTFLITQNLFSKGKYSRTISLNCHYMIIFNNPRDRSQIYFLARQMFPTCPNFLVECYEDATESKKFGYLFLDMTQTTSNKNRVQTNILPDESRIIYQIKKF